MNHMNRITEQELSARLLQSQDRIRHYITERLPDLQRERKTADELLQRTWEDAFRGLPSWRDTSPKEFDKWLRKLAATRVLEVINSQHKPQREAHPLLNSGGLKSSFLNLFALARPMAGSDSSDPGDDRRLQTIRRCVNELTGERREAVWMRYIEGRSIANIASALAQPEQVVHQLLCEGLMELREKLPDAAPSTPPRRSL